MTHYFSDAPTGPETRRTVRVQLWGEELDFLTTGGVFSADGLDLGTRVLLRESPIPSGPVRLLDLGCGWGPIAIGLARQCPQARVDAVDVNPRALALCRENAHRLGVGDRVVVRAPDEVASETRYEEIWSNPPIRIGKAALYALLLTWLPRLTPAGVARLVVAKNLGADSLQRWLADQSFRCDRTASAKGYRVLECRLG